MSRTRVTVVVAVIVVVGLIGLGIALWNFAAPPQAAQPTPTSGATQSVPPTPSEWPTPTPGATETVEPGAPVEVGIDETATVAGDITTRIVSVESFEAEDGEQPGQLAGPAVKVTIEVTNGTDAALNLNGASVNISYGDDDTPAPSLGDPVQDGLPASLEPGATGSGEYSFGLPLDVRDDVRVILDLVSGESQVVFMGSMTRG